MGNYLGVVTGLEIGVEFGFGHLRKKFQTGKKCVYLCFQRDREKLKRRSNDNKLLQNN